MNGNVSLGIGLGLTHLRGVDNADPDVGVNNLELEDGNDLLLESGDFILLE
jgi:hypothetical protein